MDGKKHFMRGKAIIWCLDQWSINCICACWTWSVEAVGEALENRFEASSSKLRRPKLLWSTNWQITEFVKNPTWKRSKPGEEESGK